jgi:hypothetical protein
MMNKVVIEIVDAGEQVHLKLEMGESFDPDNPNPCQVAAMVMANALMEWIENESKTS